MTYKRIRGLQAPSGAMVCNQVSYSLNKLAHETKLVLLGNRGSRQDLVVLDFIVWR